MLIVCYQAAPSILTQISRQMANQKRQWDKQLFRKTTATGSAHFLSKRKTPRERAGESHEQRSSDSNCSDSGPTQNMIREQSCSALKYVSVHLDLDFLDLRSRGF